MLFLQEQHRELLMESTPKTEGSTSKMKSSQSLNGVCDVKLTKQKTCDGEAKAQTLANVN